MTDLMNWTNVSNREREIILELHQESLNPGEISATLWAEYGFARRVQTIKKAIDDYADSKDDYNS